MVRRYAPEGRPEHAVHRRASEAAMKELMQFELQRLERSLADFRAGVLSPQDFTKIRTRLGIYGLRDAADRYMLRVKVPAGVLPAQALRVVADISREMTPDNNVHVTTRQDLELHGIPEQRLVEALERLLQAGLTTLGSGGPGVRNIVCCPLSGVSPLEAFDVTPYAQAVARYFLGDPAYEALPKKMKINFESCPEDHVGLLGQDIGVQAVSGPDGEPAFRIWLAGGLGALPLKAQLLEPVTPERLLLPTIVAVLNVYHRMGERKDHARARLKFLAQKMGNEAFRALILKERGEAAKNCRRLDIGIFNAADMPQHKPKPHALFVNAKFDRWKLGNVKHQRQSGLCCVFVRCPLGDMSADQARRLATLGRDFAGGSLRTAVTQNIVLRDVREERLPELYRELDAMGMAGCCAEQVMDITRCIGSGSCLSSITSSKNLALALDHLFSDGLGKDPQLKNISIKVSGCPNSCSHHHLADIGLYGVSKNVDGHAMPGYQILLGGKASLGGTTFGRPAGAVPAARAVAAVQAIVADYSARRDAQDNFGAYVHRSGIAHFTELLAGYMSLPRREENPECFRDIGETGAYRVQARRGECSV